MAKAEPEVVALNVAVRGVVTELRKRFVDSRTMLRKGELYDIVSAVGSGKYSAIVELLKHRGMIAVPDRDPMLVKFFREEWDITAAVLDVEPITGKTPHEQVKLPPEQPRAKVDGPLRPDGFRLNGNEVWGLAENWQKTLTFVWERSSDPPKWPDVTTHLGWQGTMTDCDFAKFIYKINQHVKDSWSEKLQTVNGYVVLRVPLPPKRPKSSGPQAKPSSAKKPSRNAARKSTTPAIGMTRSTRKTGARKK